MTSKLDSTLRLRVLTFNGGRRTLILAIGGRVRRGARRGVDDDGRRFHRTTDVRGSCCWCGGTCCRTTTCRPRAVGAHALLRGVPARQAARRRGDARARARRRNLKRLVVVTSLIAACITPHDGPPSLRPPMSRAAAAPPAQRRRCRARSGPSGRRRRRASSRSSAATPGCIRCAGPFRRMPSRDSRVFGAERPGDRPIECRKGHCGVDLGGEIWGEQVRAAHDGVVDRVQRAPNDAARRPLRAHRAPQRHRVHAILSPRGDRALGASRACRSRRATSSACSATAASRSRRRICTSPSRCGRRSDWPEQYVDPEPLIALWPLRIPLDELPVVLVSTAGKPGLPLGGAPAGPTHGRALSKSARKRVPTQRRQARRPRRRRAQPARRAASTTSRPRSRRNEARRRGQRSVPGLRHDPVRPASGACSSRQARAVVLLAGVPARRRAHAASGRANGATARGAALLAIALVAVGVGYVRQLVRRVAHTAGADAAVAAARAAGAAGAGSVRPAVAAHRRRVARGVRARDVGLPAAGSDAPKPRELDVDLRRRRRQARAPRCRTAGRCGVDLGGELWGEHVYAAHDGVIDRVQRSNEDAPGGLSVRIAHWGGVVFTQLLPPRGGAGATRRRHARQRRRRHRARSATPAPPTRARICTSRCRCGRRASCPRCTGIPSR